ncbi:hypothetical protein LCGC14_1447790 [marine sediment metagenome]|uniref:Uncharacterized protein n=1 Tax=marine sediment metagenome TaxID=412755 RepID=A0A0F9JJG6_9ZZZZ
MPARALIITTPLIGIPPVPNLRLPQLPWEIVTPGLTYMTRIGDEHLLLTKIGNIGAKTSFAAAGSDGILSKLGPLGADAQLLRDYHANPVLKGRALGWGVQENDRLDGFLAAVVFQGQDPDASGTDYS